MVHPRNKGGSRGVYISRKRAHGRLHFQCHVMLTVADCCAKDAGIAAVIVRRVYQTEKYAGRDAEVWETGQKLHALWSRSCVFAGAEKYTLESVIYSLGSMRAYL